MPKRKKKEHDFAVTAFRVVKEATAEKNESPVTPPESPTGKNPHAVALGRAGGKKGGPARAARLTSEQRRAIAVKAAAARWSKQKKTS